MNPPDAPPPSTAAAATPPAPAANNRREVWIARVGSWVLRLLALTLRIRVENPALVRQHLADDPCIFVFWHNRLLLIPVIWERFFARPLKGMALTSASRDGELIAQFIGRFGVGNVRGSATRRGSTAMRELARGLARGHDVGITPDGSRGPMYEVKAGLVLLAQLSGKPIRPMSFEYSRAWRTKSWDRFFIPKPFSTVTFRLGELHPVARTSNPEDFERERLRCEQALMALTVER